MSHKTLTHPSNHTTELRHVQYRDSGLSADSLGLIVALPKSPEEQRRQGRRDQLNRDEGRHVRRVDAGEGIGEPARDGHRWVGE